MELTILDLSKHLGVVPDTVERWVRQGKLPVVKAGSNYRFRTSELQKWAGKHNILLNISGKKVSEKKNESVLPLSDAVEEGGVYFDIQGDDVQSVLTACLERIPKVPTDFKSEILDRLIEREQALSTGIGNGIAIPHPRVPLSCLSAPLVAVCFLETPVDYRAMDQQPVEILFLILCPDLKFHLHLLSSLSFCLRDKSFAQFLKSRPDPVALIERIEARQKLNTF